MAVGIKPSVLEAFPEEGFGSGIAGESHSLVRFWAGINRMKHHKLRESIYQHNKETSFLRHVALRPDANEGK